MEKFKCLELWHVPSARDYEINKQLEIWKQLIDQREVAPKVLLTQEEVDNLLKTACQKLMLPNER